MSNKSIKKNRFGNNFTNKNKLLEWNSYGIFFTCEYEKDGVREANNLISKYLDEVKSNESEQATDDNDVDDISDMLKKAAEEASKPSTIKRIRQQQTGIKHCLYFTISDIERENIVDFTDKIINDCQKIKQCRFLQRCLPIEDVSSDDESMLRPKLERILTREYQKFSEEFKDKHATFAVDFKSRFSEYKRQDALDIVCEIIKNIDFQSKVNLSNPDFTIIFHVIKKAILVSCVRGYNQRKKFNLSPSEVKQDSKDTGEGSIITS